MDLQLCQEGQLCGCSVLPTRQGGGEASKIFGAGSVGYASSFPSVFLQVLGAPPLSPPETLAKLYEFMYNLFREETINLFLLCSGFLEPNSQPWGDIDKPKMDRGTLRYTSTEQLISDDIKDNGDGVCAAR